MTLTELLLWVDILPLVSVDIDHDHLGGAVRQAGVQTGHCDQDNNITALPCIFKGIRARYVFSPLAP